MPQKTNKLNPFKLSTTTFLPPKERLHIYGKDVICITDNKGFATPQNLDLAKLVVDASNGIIPLWSKGVTLNWRFCKSFDSYFNNPKETRKEITLLFAEAIIAWKDATPVKFHYDEDAWDFEITISTDLCNQYGCVLASAFFPQQGRNKLVIYPKMFEQSRKEQVETLIHELGHIFGLRHFFAKLSESNWKSELFGTQNENSIMNYGEKSKLTNTDINDLKNLYKQVWSGLLTEINGTRIVQFLSYHMSTSNQVLVSF